eukprot:TRINITY_DN23360_c0_g1_i2.p1 TRINITY_DN23360_c0_g1~~TRINITY_DN23360_c0_g1_i2.p1  ORF type:complete len:186 (+),score=55.60 TRINITY_DN23360_c0_g1_i2:67-558(+)
MAAAAVHPRVECLRWLLGTWRGRGQGSFPTMKSFEYEEEVTYAHPTPLRPVVSYRSRTWRNKPDTGERQPMHGEDGWLVLADEQGTVKGAVAHSFGLAETTRGTATSASLELRSTDLPHADKVTAVIRTAGLAPDGTLRTSVHMATQTVTEPTQHLVATLTRD